ncbi:MAG: sugar ABC transporter permease, partial [Anaerolineales bacterium]|nr:sugar ABC transporter permease [Anaerolineales bacterium]
MTEPLAVPTTEESQPARKPWLRRLGFGVWRADQQPEGYLFLLPSLLGFITFVIFPIIASFILSFYRWDLLTPAEFVGVGNYVELAT